MKTLQKIKLTKICKSNLEYRQMKDLLAGAGDCSGACACGCDGSSSTFDNRNANNTTYTPYSGFNRVDAFWNC